jgi:hypothetical protein
VIFRTGGTPCALIAITQSSGSALILAVILTGCAPSAASIAQAVSQTQSGWTAVPSQTPYSTQTPWPTYTQLPTQTRAATVAVTVLVTVEVTRIIDRPVTVTPTPTPIDSPTVTDTPTDTPIPSDTPRPTDTPSETPTPNEAQTATAAAFAALTEARPDGNYLVNIDIAPGVWRNDGSGSDGTNCYWERLTKTGAIINNYIGAGGGTMFVGANDFQVHMENCGTWTYLGL